MVTRIWVAGETGDEGDCTNSLLKSSLVAWFSVQEMACREVEKEILSFFYDARMALIG